MPELQQLLHDKKIWYVAGIGGAVGLYAWYRNRQSSPAAAGGAGGTVATGAGVPSVDTTPQDVNSALGNFGGQLQNVLGAYQSSLSNSVSQLSALAAATPPTGPSTAGPEPKYQQVLAGWNAQQWVSDVARGYGYATNSAGAAVAGGNPTLTLQLAEALNPNLSADLNPQGNFVRPMTFRVQ